jgi:PAS domain S-box-containing protein
MAFDVRAMENIATAPASPGERIAGRWASVLAVALVAVAFPFGRIGLPPISAFVPSVLVAAVLTEVLTALLFYVQYRISRSPQLAMLTIGYGASAYITLFYILTFPNVFSPHGLFHATLQTAPWANAIDHVAFGGFIVAFALAGRREIALDRVAARWVAAGTLVLLAFVSYATIALPLPAILDAGTRFTPFFNHVIEPIQFAIYAAALALLITGPRHTVTQVWLVVVVLMRAIEALAVSGFTDGRYTLFWYFGRAFVLVSSSVMLAVFIVKLNDLLLRLARRNRALTERSEIAELELAQGELRYRSLANVVPQLIWSANAAGGVDYVNDRWVEYTGLDARDTRRVGWFAAIDDAEKQRAEAAWAASLASGDAFSGEYRLRERGTDRSCWFLINAIAIRDRAANVSRWIGSCTDIDQQKRIEEREAFLAGAGDRLSASLDLDATLDTIAELVVGRMAMWARLDLVGDDGRFLPAVVASADPAEHEALRGLLGRPVSDRLAEIFTAALMRKEPIVDRDLLALAGGAPGVRSGVSIVVPLSSGDTFIGTLSLVRAGRAIEPDDVAVARDFGRRAAQALDHARLYERERTTADALQRAMLPQVLPLIPDVAFSASYSAASESQRVGGDFYDAFTLPDGRVAVTIGDVTGHGLEAAVIMGEIRQTLRAASFERADPAAILDRASKLLVASGRTVFVTAIFGVLDTATGRFVYASAGHPAPLVYDGSKLLRLATSGLPIGLRDDEGVDFAITLPPNSTLVLYTDGLLEFSRDLDEGERRIEGAIRDLDVNDIDHLAGAIMKRVLLEDQASDDIAILTATIGERGGAVHDVREWRFASTDSRTSTLVRHAIGDLVANWTGRAEPFLESELVFGELFSNVVRHAPGPVDVRAAATPSGAEVVVADRGTGFPGVPGVADQFAESGRGLHLVRALSDAVRIESSTRGTRITVAFYRDASASSTGHSSELSNA